jgi:hypothetical protein
MGEKNILVFHYLIKQLTPKFEKIVESDTINNWLEEDDEEYTRDCAIISEQLPDFGDSKFHTFVKNHGKAIPRIKGGGLKEAIFDNLYNVLHDDIDVERILKLAKKKYEGLKAQNKESLRQLVGFVEGVDWGGVVLKRYERLSGCEKGVIFALAIGFNIGQFKPSQRITKLDLKEVFNSVVKDQRVLILSDAYSDFAHVTSNLPKSEDGREAFAKVLSQTFHISTQFIGDDVQFMVHDISIIKHLDGKVFFSSSESSKSSEPVSSPKPSISSISPEEEVKKLKILKTEDVVDKGGVAV